MILVDYSNVTVSTIMAQLGFLDNEFDENLIRHMIFNTLISYHNKFKSDYGNMVLLRDSKNYWRKDFYPYYKIKRKDMRENSQVNWDKLYQIMNKITQEISDNLPIKIMEVDKAEADDCIAVIVKSYQNEAHMIVSNDKDFQQLQKYKKVKQYAPLRNAFYTTDNPEKFLKEHIIRGDSGDGIPNILSDDDVFVSPDKRQKPIRKAKLNSEWMKQRFEDFVDDKDKIERNKVLIDFDYIPNELHDKIIEEYKIKRPTRKLTDVIKYILSKDMKLMVDKIQDLYK